MNINKRNWLASTDDDSTKTILEGNALVTKSPLVMNCSNLVLNILRLHPSQMGEVLLKFYIRKKSRSDYHSLSCCE